MSTEKMELIKKITEYAEKVNDLNWLYTIMSVLKQST